MTVLPPTPDATHSVKVELAAAVLQSSGHLRLQVNGWSMLPSIWPGDTLLIERAKQDDVTEGNVVLFRRHERLFAHRVVSRADSHLRTRGDGMFACDDLVDSSELLGRVTAVWRGSKCIGPRKRLSVFERVIATLVRRSEFVARVVVRVHGICQLRAVQS